MTALLEIQDLTVRRGECPVVDSATFRIAPGECVGLIGPNGAGKTTLLRAALGLIAHEGRSSLAALSARARAKHAAWLPQAREIAWPIGVERLVTLGRLPHLPWGTRPAPQDRAAIASALDRMGLSGFETRRASELSGGEQARVLIARALAQESPLLMADEPIAGLDPAAQITTLETFSNLAREGRAVLTSLHDLSLAARYCTRLLLMNQGQVVADGAPGDVLTEGTLAEVFHLRAWVHETPEGPIYQPLGVVK